MVEINNEQNIKDTVKNASLFGYVLHFGGNLLDNQFDKKSNIIFGKLDSMSVFNYCVYMRDMNGGIFVYFENIDQYKYALRIIETSYNGMDRKYFYDKQSLIINDADLYGDKDAYIKYMNKKEQLTN